jgi:hypothetical protein
MQREYASLPVASVRSQLVSRLGKKDADFLFAHDGKEGVSQTNVKRAGRDRTKIGMARKRKLEEDLLEMDEEEFDSRRVRPAKRVKVARATRRAARRGA